MRRVRFCAFPYGDERYLFSSPLHSSLTVCTNRPNLTVCTNRQNFTRCLNWGNQRTNHPTTEELNYVAIWDYPPLTRGERMCILENEGDWWHAQFKDGQEGYVPSNHVALVGSIECKDWFFGKKSEKECERMLIQQEPKTYMITESKTEPGIHRISLTIQEGLTLLVKHQTIPLPHDWDDKQAFIDDYIRQALREYGIMRCGEKEKPETSGIAPDVVEIGREQLNRQKKLGAGMFGEVWKGFMSPDGFQRDIKVAIKILQRGTMSSKDFLREAKILRKLRHPNIVSIYAVVPTEPINIVTEYMCHGSLLDYLKDGPGSFFPLVDLIDMAAQIAAGMAFIEQEKYIHRDLRADNVLVGENRVCKVADCGLARFIKDDVYMSTGSKFPVKWTAPEAIIHRRFTIKSDVWSFGILLTEILTKGKQPYPGMHNQAVVQKVYEGYRIPKKEITPYCPVQLYALMLQCWDEDDDERPGFESIQDTLEEFCYGTSLSRSLLEDI